MGSTFSAKCRGRSGEMTLGHWGHKGRTALRAGPWTHITYVANGAIHCLCLLVPHCPPDHP